MRHVRRAPSSAASGGSFEKNFENFMRQVLPEHRLRVIEFDHDVYRGGQYHVPYQLPRGCPIYRDHGSSAARGIFAKDGRLMVFLSPGDLGSAWASVAYVSMTTVMTTSGGDCRVP